MPKTPNIDRRFQDHFGLELRVEEGKTPTLFGTVTPFDTETVIAGQWREVIRKGAFAADIKNDEEVLGLAQHDTALPLARRSAGSLELSEDKEGLKFSMNVAQTTYGKDLVESVRAGVIKGMSFGFIPRKIQWSEGDGDEDGDGGEDRDKLDLREILDVRLLEISPVTFPAFPETSVESKAAHDQFLAKRQAAIEHERFLCSHEHLKRRQAIRTILVRTNT